MTEAVQEHRYDTWRFLFVLACVIVGATASIRMTTRLVAPPPKVATLSLNFQVRVCDNAWQNEIHHEDDDTDHVPVTLHEGCFSGYVNLPKTWKAWWVQPSGDQTGDWIAYWMPGNNPIGPYLPNQAYQIPGIPLQLRVQGHGKYVFYSNVKVSHPANSEPKEKSIQPRPASGLHSAISPTSGASAHYSLLLQECRRDGEKILCSLKATNNTDARTQLWLHPGESKAVDDEGNQASMTITVSGNDNHLLPGVPLNYELQIADNHQNAKVLTILIKASFYIGPEETEEIIYKDVPIQ